MNDHSRCTRCLGNVSGRSDDVKVICEVFGVLHLECARKWLGPHAFLVPSRWYVPQGARMY